MTATYFHSSELPWNPALGEEKRFRAIVTAFLILSLALSLIFALVTPPKLDRAAAERVPPRLAKLVLEKKQLPKVEEPKPKEEEKKPEDEAKKDKPEEKKKPEEKPQAKPLEPLPEQAPVQAAAPPKKTVEELRKKAASAGILAMADQLADLRDNSLLENVGNTRLAGPSDVLSAGPGGAAGGGRVGERAMITSNATRGSGGINTAALSRDVGAPGALATRATTKVASPVVEKEQQLAKAELAGPDGKGRRHARTQEEINLVIDRYKSSLQAIYQRALRDDPSLKGNVVFEISIDPEGKVVDCKVVSSELKNEDLERKLSTRIKMFSFGAKEVELMVVTVPLNFTPSL